MLYPKKNGAIGKNKPVAIIVNSPYDHSDGATKFTSKRDILDNDGFGILNKAPIFFDTIPERLNGALKPMAKISGDFVLYANAHGAPGWFFGADRDLRRELLGLYQFAKLVENIEADRGKEITTIVLGGCYNAVELFQPSSGNSFLSPARLLSMVFPNKNVVGFLGQFADARVTHVYKPTEEGFSAVSVSPWEASVLFRGGSVVERNTQRLFCSHQHTPDFVKEPLDISEAGRNDYFLPTLREEMPSAALVNHRATNMARIQEVGVAQIRERMSREREVRPNSSPSM